MLWLSVRGSGLTLSPMHPMRQAERGRDSTLLAGGCPALAGGSCPMKCDDFSHRREETPGTPLLHPSSGGFLTGKLLRSPILFAGVFSPGADLDRQDVGQLLPN